MKKTNKTSMARKPTGKLKRRRGAKAREKPGAAARAKAGVPAQKKQKKPTGKKRGPKPGMNLRFNWAGVDWALRDAEIARSLGVSRERVRQVRKEKGLPPSGIGRSTHSSNADGSRTDRSRRVGRPRRPRSERPPTAVVPRAYGWDEAKWR